MMLYLQGSGKNGESPQSSADFENELSSLEDRFVHYGCYCWINGLADGVIGGGKTKDVVDHHCKELYRCYKCVTADYNANYTDVSYVVDFGRKNNERNLDCTVNSKQDSENICECDKRFAMNIAKADADCAANSPADPEWGNHCMDEKYRTVVGGGPFEPKTQCDKQFHGHDKGNCCGIYPNRFCDNSIVNSNAVGGEYCLGCILILKHRSFKIKLFCCQAILFDYKMELNNEFEDLIEKICS